MKRAEWHRAARHGAFAPCALQMPGQAGLTRRPPVPKAPSQQLCSPGSASLCAVLGGPAGCPPQTAHGLGTGPLGSCQSRSIGAERAQGISLQGHGKIAPSSHGGVSAGGGSTRSGTRSRENYGDRRLGHFLVCRVPLPCDPTGNLGEFGFRYLSGLYGPEDDTNTHVNGAWGASWRQ